LRACPGAYDPLDAGAYNARALRAGRRTESTGAVGRWVAMLGVLAWLLASTSPGLVWAEPDVSMSGADDGTVLLVGSGWKPGQQLLVSVGREIFPTQADTAGGFEIHTTLPFDATSGAALSVRPFASSLNFAALPPAPLAPAAPPTPHPLAVLFAHAVADGATWLGAGCLALAAAGASARLLRSGRPAGRQ